MTVERTLTQLSNLLGGFDRDTEAQVTDLLEQLVADAHEEGFSEGQEAGESLAEFYEEGNYGDEEEDE